MLEARLGEAAEIVIDVLDSILAESVADNPAHVVVIFLVEELLELEVVSGFSMRKTLEHLLLDLIDSRNLALKLLSADGMRQVSLYPLPVWLTLQLLTNGRLPVGEVLVHLIFCSLDGKVLGVGKGVKVIDVCGEGVGLHQLLVVKANDFADFLRVARQVDGGVFLLWPLSLELLVLLVVVRGGGISDLLDAEAQASWSSREADVREAGSKEGEWVGVRVDQVCVVEKSPAVDDLDVHLNIVELWLKAQALQWHRQLLLLRCRGFWNLVLLRPWKGVAGGVLTGRTGLANSSKDLLELKQEWSKVWLVYLGVLCGRCLEDEYVNIAELSLLWRWDWCLVVLDEEVISEAVQDAVDVLVHVQIDCAWHAWSGNGVGALLENPASHLG